MNLSKADLYAYGLTTPILESLELVSFDDDIELLEGKSSSPPKNHQKSQESNVDDFTRFNGKRVERGLLPITEEEFDNLLEKLSIESISGSESESESEDEDESGSEHSLYQRFKETQITDNSPSDTSTNYLNTKSPYLFLKSLLIPEDKNLAIYKSLFTQKELQTNPIQAMNLWNHNQLIEGKSALLMIGGGHFAGAIVSHKPKNMKGNVINHKVSLQEQQVNLLDSKTFHRYTTRRKQGGSQNASDNARGKANSAGSTIRRYNEQALVQEVRELLQSWSCHLNDCHSVFIRANGASNRKILVGYEGGPLKNNDIRIKTFPFSTRRATTSELKRAWVNLSHLSIENAAKSDITAKKKLLQQQENLKRSQQQTNKPGPQQQLSVSDKNTLELINLMKKSKAPMLINFVKKNKISPNTELTPHENHKQTPTLLHYASSQGLAHMVQILLVNLKADPTIQNDAGRVPAELSLNTNVKNMFQICRHKIGEDQFDWNKAKVGDAKTKEQIDHETQLENDRIHKEKQHLIQQELNKKTEMEIKKPSFSSHGTLSGNNPSLVSNLSGLNDDQKKRLMREQRARAAEERLKKVSK